MPEDFATGREGKLVAKLTGTMSRIARKYVCGLAAPGDPWGGTAVTRIWFGFAGASVEMGAGYSIQNDSPCDIAVREEYLKWDGPCDSGQVGTDVFDSVGATDNWLGDINDSVSFSVTIEVDVIERAYFEDTGISSSINNRPDFFGLSTIPEGLPITSYVNYFMAKEGGTIKLDAQIASHSISKTCTVSSPFNVGSTCGVNYEAGVAGDATNTLSCSMDINGEGVWGEIIDDITWDDMPDYMSVSLSAGSLNISCSAPAGGFGFDGGWAGAPRCPVTFDAKCYAYNRPYTHTVGLRYLIGEVVSPFNDWIVKDASVSGGSASIGDFIRDFGFSIRSNVSATIPDWSYSAGIAKAPIIHAWLFDSAYDDTVDYRGYIHGRKFDITGCDFLEDWVVENSFSSGVSWDGTPMDDGTYAYIPISEMSAGISWGGTKIRPQFFRYARIRLNAAKPCEFVLRLGTKDYRVVVPHAGVIARLVDLTLPLDVTKASYSGASDRLPVDPTDKWKTSTDGLTWGLNEFETAQIKDYFGEAQSFGIADIEFTNLDDLRIDSMMPREEWFFYEPGTPDWYCQRAVQIHNRDKIVLDLPCVLRQEVIPDILWDWDEIPISAISLFTGSGMGINVGTLNSDVDDGFHNAGRYMAWIGGQGRIWEGGATSTLMLNGKQHLDKLRCQALYDVVLLEPMSGTGWNTGTGGFNAQPMTIPVTKVIRSSASGIVGTGEHGPSRNVGARLNIDPSPPVGDWHLTDRYGVYIAGAPPYGRHEVDHFVEFDRDSLAGSVFEMRSRKRHRQGVGVDGDEDVANCDSPARARYTFIASGTPKQEVAFGPYGGSLSPAPAPVNIRCKSVDEVRAHSGTVDKIYSVLVDEDDSNAKVFISVNQGVSYLLMAVVGPATDVAITMMENGDIFVYRIEGSNIFVHRYDRSGVMRETQETGITDASPIGISATPSRGNPHNPQSVELAYVNAIGEAVKVLLKRGMDV